RLIMNFKKFGFLLIVLVFSLTVIGCSASTSDSDQDKDNGDPKRGGTLNFAYHAQPSTLDPHMTTADATRDVSNHIFEGLLTLNSNLEATPMLAESYEVS